ncbi:MAG: transglutaminase-like domain-containing protein [Rikenellaceae bacterium]
MKIFLISLLSLMIGVSNAAPSKQNPELTKALKKAPKEQKEGMAFLIEYMPQSDKETLTAEFLLEEVAWAYKARETFPWTKALPDSIFFNDVLPYASMDETREPWREMFWELFYPLVKDVTDIRVAIDTINKMVKDLVGVEYNTKRKRPNQSPRESMEISMASCSGLSIILTDVFRAMGIPSRIAGTPLWVTREGNHNWSEVWIDGQWYFTEYYPNEALNHSWFLERAGKADKSDPIYGMYATSWKTQPDGQHFPMVWDRRSTEVPGVVVTDFYIDLYNAQKAEAKNGTAVAFKMYVEPKSGSYTSADRLAGDIKITNAKGDIVAVGTTKGANADMNDYLVLYLPEGDLTVNYTDAAGSAQTKDFAVAADAVVEIFSK